MRNIVKIQINHMWESCQRDSYYVQLTTDEGFTMDVCCHQTGSIYTDFKGLSKEEALDRALWDAHDWGDFLEIPVEPFIEDGKTIECKLKFERYTARRVIEKRKKEKQSV